MKKYLTTAELAKLMGVSRVTAFKKIKAGKIRAAKVGRAYVIEKRNLPEVLRKKPSAKTKKEIEKAVKKAVREYKETLILLGKE